MSDQPPRTIEELVAMIDGTGWDHHVVPFFPVEDERA